MIVVGRASVVVVDPEATAVVVDGAGRVEFEPLDVGAVVLVPPTLPDPRAGFAAARLDEVVGTHRTSDARAAGFDSFLLFT